MNVFVIGAGASGLVSAIEARKYGCRVTILERNKNCGKKLLITGAGRCNYYNENQDIKFYHSQNLELFKDIFESKKDSILPFFNSLGIIPKINNGYYYPYSNRSTSIVNALVNKALSLDIKIITDTLVTKIEKKDKFIIHTENKTYTADKVIISTGSKAYPKTGSDGIGYNIVKELGHTTTKILPSLTGVVGKDNFYKDWKGVRSDAILTLVEDGNKVKQERGEVQFTDFGISGICTFNLSGIISRGLSEEKKEEVFINFIPWFEGEKEEFLVWMNNQNEMLKGYKLKDILEGFLNYKIVNLILKLSHTNIDAKWNEVNKDNIIDLIMNFKVEAESTKSYDFSQVCIGGIPLSEINTKTMESLKTRGLYLTGEILDVDGDCGGYNLSFAWMSGLIAGESVGKND